MASYRTTVDSTWTPERAFEYLADFSSVRHWDPSVVRANRLDDGPVGLGSRFHVVTQFRGREIELDYELIEHDPVRSLVLQADNGRVRSLDRITFEPAGTGCRVTYDADLRLKGLLRLGDPLLQRAFDRLGDEARDGLARELNR